MGDGIVNLLSYGHSHGAMVHSKHVNQNIPTPTNSNNVASNSRTLKPRVAEADPIITLDLMDMTITICVKGFQKTYWIRKC